MTPAVGQDTGPSTIEDRILYEKLILVLNSFESIGSSEIEENIAKQKKDQK